jgi:hypothetical protein
MAIPTRYETQVNADFDRAYDDYLQLAKHIKETQMTKADEYQVGGMHYKDMAVEPWAVMEEVLTQEEFVGFLKGNVIKYSMRQGKKEGSDDGAKALHYLAKLREVKEL